MAARRRKPKESHILCTVWSISAGWPLIYDPGAVLSEFDQLWGVRGSFYCPKTPPLRGQQFWGFLVRKREPLSRGNTSSRAGWRSQFDRTIRNRGGKSRETDFSFLKHRKQRIPLPPLRNGSVLTISAKTFRPVWGHVTSAKLSKTRELHPVPFVDPGTTWWGWIL